MLADRRQVVHHRDTERLEVLCIAHAAQLEQLGRVERAAAEHDFLGVHRVLGAAHAVLDTRGAVAVEQHPVHQCAGGDREVRSLHHRVQVGAGSTEPTAAVHVAVEPREALLAVAVHVGGARVTGLLRGGEERLDQRVVGRTALEHEGAVTATEVVGAGEAGLHLLEVRQAVGVVPSLHTRVGAPALVVHRVAALEDHPVDAARAPEHLAAGVVHLATVHERLGLGLVLPVVEAAADGEHQRGRHVDEDVPLVVGASGFEHEHLVRGVGTQPVGECGSGGAASDDDVVVGGIRHGFLEVSGGVGRGSVRVVRSSRQRCSACSPTPPRGRRLRRRSGCRGNDAPGRASGRRR